jgi:hypothetical protein
MWITSILKCGVFLWTLMYMCMLFVDSHVCEYMILCVVTRGEHIRRHF